MYHFMKTQFTLLLILISTCIFAQERQTLDSLTKILEKIYYEDQLPRQQIEPIEKQYGYSSPEIRKLWELINRTDSVNTIVVSDIIDKYGWIGPDQISDTANRALFIVIQHADKETQLKYLDILKNASQTGKAKPSQYALLLDRTNLKLGKFQEYGSQLYTLYTGHTVFEPIRDEPNVNKRRQSVGLSTLEEYSAFFDVSYILPKQDLYKNCYVVKGFVLDTTGKPLKEVSIYLDKKTATISDEFGYYILPIKKKVKSAEIRYCKKGYQEGKYILAKEGDRDIYEKFMWLFEIKNPASNPAKE
jgi:hypothetical protein